MNQTAVSRRRNLFDIEFLEARFLLSLTNPGFESGLAGWQTQEPFSGAASVKASFQGRSAVEGSSFALLSSGLDTASTSISQTFHAEAGDVISGKAFFSAEKSTQANDAGAIKILSSDGSVVATPFSAAANASDKTLTPWTSFTYTFTTAGDYTIQATTSNVGECSPATYLGIDALQYTSSGNNNNPPPTGNTITTSPDSYTTAQDTALTISPPGVLGNDASTGTAALTAALVTGPAHGTLNLNSNGGFTYTPSAGYSGSDTFTYTASATDATSANGTVTLTITPASNNPPPGQNTITAMSDAYTTQQETALTVPAPGVLGNDTSTGTAPLMATLTTEPSHGTVNLSSDGSFTYTPAAGFSGADSFAYNATSADATQDNAVVSITVTPATQPPPTNGGVTYDLRFADGTKSKVVTAPGTYTVDLWAQLDDPNPPITDDALSYGLVNIISQQINGGAIASGGVTAGETAPLFTRGIESRDGSAANLNNDGIGDWGSNQAPSQGPAGLMRFISSNTTPTGIKAQIAGTPVAGEAEPTANGWEWRVATFTITVTSVGNSPTGETDFLPQFPSGTSPLDQSLILGFFRDAPGLTSASAPTPAVQHDPRTVGDPLRFLFSTTPIL